MHEDPMIEFLKWQKDASSKLLSEIQAASSRGPSVNTQAACMRATLRFLTELNEQAVSVPDGHPCCSQVSMLLADLQKRALEGLIEWREAFRKLALEHTSGRN